MSVLLKTFGLKVNYTLKTRDIKKNIENLLWLSYFPGAVHSLLKAFP